MGQMFNQPVQQPAPANATVIPQEIAWGNCYWSCQGPRVPRWLRQQPNQMLIQCGLSADALNQEIDALNAKAVEYVNSQNDMSHYFGYLAIGIIVACAIAAAVLGSSMEYNFGMTWIAFWLGIVIASLMNWGIRSRHRTLWNQCLNAITTYIQNEVTPRYQSVGLTWTIRSRSVRHGSGRNGYYITYNDICITPPMQQPVAIQQQPAIVYVDQNGNPIQPQQQQVIIVNQQGVPIQNQMQTQPQTGPGAPGVPLQVLQTQSQPQAVASAPPAYEAPPAYAPEEGQRTNI